MEVSNSEILLSEIRAIVESNGLQLESIAELLGYIYTAQLFCIGAVGAVLVCVILYRFLKAFY